MSKFFVATAIPYVNAKPHLGHALEFLYADVLARYQRQRGADVCFSIGTDEHGVKIAEKAQQVNQDPQAFVDEMSQAFVQMAARLNISQTHFIRTTSQAHKDSVSEIWRRLSNWIYQDTFVGWYCVGCEEYKTETVVKETGGRCPLHDRAYEKLKETNYFFKASAFADQIKQIISSGQLEIIPQSAVKETLAFLESGLVDTNISRPTSSLEWGIGVPNDPKQVIYVWFEALMNYITVLGYPDNKTFKDFWPAQVQVLGRDILRFHAIIWPAMLLALKLPLPAKLYIHGLVTVDGQKMSKTLGNTVEPLELVDTYGLDAFRYFFLRHIPAHGNGDYSSRRFVAAYNNELGNELGNLISRLQALIVASDQSIVSNHQLANLPGYDQALADCQFNRALNLVWSKIQALNRFLETKQPWRLTGSDQAQVLTQAVEDLKTISYYLQPFLPDTAQVIDQIFQKDLKPLKEPLFPRK